MASGSKSTRTCWRCGVDFDPSGFADEAPCPDCQPDVPGIWTSHWSKGNRRTPEIMAAREADIRRLHGKQMVDGQIASVLGISKETVQRWRKRLGLRRNDFINDEVQTQRQEAGKDLVKHRWGY